MKVNKFKQVKIIFVEFLITAFLYFGFSHIGSVIEKNNPYLQQSFLDIFIYLITVIWFLLSFIIANIIKILILFIFKKMGKTISNNKKVILTMVLYSTLMFLPLIEVYNLNIYKIRKESKIIINNQEKPVMNFSEFINRIFVFFEEQKKEISEATLNDSIEYNKYLNESGYQDSVFYLQEIQHIFNKKDKCEFLLNSENVILEKRFCNGKVKILNRDYHNVTGSNLTVDEFNNLKLSYLLRPDIPNIASNITFSYYKLDIPSELSQSLSYEVPVDTKITITDEITKIDTFEIKKVVHWLYENL